MRQIFWDFVKERERVRTRKEHGAQHPLTQDPRLQKYWFPNIRREDDRTTVWFRAMVRDQISDPFQLLMAIVVFRQFNLIEIGELLLTMMLSYGYDTDMLLKTLGPREGRLFNAHMGSRMSGRTLEAVVRTLEAFEASDHIHIQLEEDSLENATQALQKVKGIGPEMAYELVCDLRHTGWLMMATDKKSWASPTTGACLGAGHILERELHTTRKADREETKALMYELLSEPQPISMGWEMCEVQRALCLFNTWARKAQPKGVYRWK